MELVGSETSYMLSRCLLWMLFSRLVPETSTD